MAREAGAFPVIWRGRVNGWGLSHRPFKEMRRPKGFKRAGLRTPPPRQGAPEFSCRFSRSFPSVGPAAAERVDPIHPLAILVE